MRNLPLLALLLLSMLVAATSAQASPLPLLDQIRPLAGFEEEDEFEADDEDAEWDESEACEPEEGEPCEEVEESAGKSSKAKERGTDDECLLKNASAAVAANPGKRQLRLTVHYRTLKPATVSVAASLQGPKGAVRLGTEHARFRRSGTYRDTYELTEKQAKKALPARELSVELHVVNAPSSCGVELTAASPRARH